MRRRRAAVVLLVVSATAWGGIGLLDAPVPDGAAVDDAALVRPVENGSAIWPYTSRSRSVAGRTLAITIVVAGNADSVRYLLTERTARDWEPTQDDIQAAVNETGIDWRPARGAARYTYVRPPDADGQWVTAAYQLATGSYLGARLHLRAYPAPNGEWTALQAHQEYWDWFRLRHTVTGVAEAGQTVETDLRSVPVTGPVSRIQYGFDAGGSDGWLTVVEVAMAVVLLGGVIGAGRGPLGRRLPDGAGSLALVGGLAGLVLAVRAIGIALGGTVPTVDPRLFAAGLYPVLVAGPLVVTWRLAPGHPPAAAFALAVVGLGAGIAIDLWALGVIAPPRRLLLHRTVLLAALGLVAAGFAAGGASGRRVRTFGLVAWIGALAAPLVGVV